MQEQDHCLGLDCALSQERATSLCSSYPWGLALLILSSLQLRANVLLRCLELWVMGICPHCDPSYITLSSDFARAADSRAAGNSRSGLRPTSASGTVLEKD